MFSILKGNRNPLEKYKDIISKSTLIHPGSPALYQLRPERNKVEDLTRVIIGEKNPNKINKTILLVGEIGTGKSTLVNVLVNHAMGVVWEDNIWFLMEEEENRAQLESQTSDVIVYNVFGFEDKTLPYSLTIVDTPGYGSTKGIEHDDIVSKELLELFSSEDGVNEVNVVGLVLKASEGRLSDRLRYIFDSVVSLFGKDIEKKIVVLITHSTGETPTNVLKALEASNIKSAKNERQQPVHFLFDNRQKAQKEVGSNNENQWRVTKKGMGQFTAFLERSTPQKLRTTVKVLEKRSRLAACVKNMKERMKLVHLKQSEIQQTQEALKKHEQEMKKNEGFTVEVDEVYKDKETIPGGSWALFFFEGAVVCTVCEENCHYPGCTVCWSPRDCSAMTRGHCTVCTKKCPVSAHVKVNWKFVEKTRKVPKIDEEMNEAFEKNKDESVKKYGQLENQDKAMKELIAQTHHLVEEAYQHVVSLEEIALNVRSLSTCMHLDSLIEKMKEQGDTKKVQKLEKMRSQVDEEVKTGLRYMFGKVTVDW